MIISSNSFGLRNAILCPSCERGIITKYTTSSTIFDYDDGTCRIGMTTHMRCPYCGDHVLCADGGYNLTYNYIDPQYERLKSAVLKCAKLTSVDIRE